MAAIYTMIQPCLVTGQIYLVEMLLCKLYIVLKFTDTKDSFVFKFTVLRVLTLWKVFGGTHMVGFRGLEQYSEKAVGPQGAAWRQQCLIQVFLGLQGQQ